MDSYIFYNFLTDNYTGNAVINLCNPNLLKFLKPSNNTQEIFIKSIDRLLEETVMVHNTEIKTKPLNARPVARLRRVAVVFVGFGGYMSNVKHYESLKNRYAYNNILRYYNYYENDNLSFTNIPRMAGQLDHHKILMDNEPSNKLDFYTLNGNKYFKYLDENELNDLKSRYSRIIFVGSPDMQTRKLLENEMFFFFGNRDNSFTIVKSPTASNMAIDAYGKIDIPKFFVGCYHSADYLEQIISYCATLAPKDFEKFKNEKNVYIADFVVNEKEEI